MENYNHKRVLVVVPLYKAELSADEKLSIRHLEHFLNHYDRCFIVPQSLAVERGDFLIRRFPDDNFRSVQSYSKLLLSREFYQSFIDYEYILIYQLDSLVFSDQILVWCQNDFDYIGAPWLRFQSGQYVEEFTRAGNGGFSLRKVRSMIRVIDARQCLKDDANFYGSDFGNLSPRYSSRYGNFERFLLKLGILNSAEWYLSKFEINEDIFWSYMAPRICPAFKVAPVNQALSFSFEMLPSFCYAQNNFKLPFGCHAWRKYDKDFWAPHLIYT